MQRAEEHTGKDVSRLNSIIASTTKSASNCMILQYVTTYAFLQNRSAKYQRSVKNFTRRLLVIIQIFFVVVKEKEGGVKNWKLPSFQTNEVALF